MVLLDALAKKGATARCSLPMLAGGICATGLRPKTIVSSLTEHAQVHCAARSHPPVVGEAGWRMLDAKVLLNRDDVKFAILPKNRFLQKIDNKIDNQFLSKIDNCTVITLGIGGDVVSELKLQKFLPYCQFFGADPSYDQGQT